MQEKILDRILKSRVERAISILHFDQARSVGLLNLECVLMLPGCSSLEDSYFTLLDHNFVKTSTNMPNYDRDCKDARRERERERKAVELSTGTFQLDESSKTVEVTQTAHTHAHFRRKFTKNVLLQTTFPPSRRLSFSI